MAGEKIFARHRVFLQLFLTADYQLFKIKLPNQNKLYESIVIL